MSYLIEEVPLHIVNVPPSHLFPACDVRPGPCVENYLTDPDYPAAAYLKNRIRAEQVLSH